MKLRWLLLFIFSSFPLISSAEIFAESAGISGNAYVGIHFSGMRYEQGDGYNVHQSMIGLRGGYEIANHFGIEGQLSTGLQDDEFANPTLLDPNRVVTVGVDYLAGLYLRGSIFLWDPRARLYGLAGVTRGKITQDVIGSTITETKDQTDPSYGFGFEFYGDERNAVSIEFMRYLKGDDSNGINYNLDAFNLGYVHRF
jgi:hypothetical protein